MKNIIKILLLIFFVSSCSNTKKEIEQPIKKFEVAKNIVGIVKSIDKNNVTILSNNNSFTFDIKEVKYSNISVDDEISVVYNGDLENISSIKVVSLIMQKKASKDNSIISLNTVVENGTNYKILVVNNGLKLLIDDVPIEFEGSLIAGMKVSIEYVIDKTDEYDGVLKSLKILE